MSAAPPRVLVVDDEPPIRKLLRMGLGAHGYHVIEATNGKNALELLGKSPDIIILDLGLPDIQGHDLLRMIQGPNEAVPVIVLSSRGDEAGKVQAFDLGADDYVTKPFGMDELVARIRAAFAINCKRMANGQSSRSMTFRSIWSVAPRRALAPIKSSRRGSVIRMMFNLNTHGLIQGIRGRETRCLI
jgi:DNA-binding response OmpR family regulator